MVKRRNIINIINGKNSDITEEMLNILIYIIETFDKIYKRHINMLLSNNLNFIYINLNDIKTKEVLYIEIIISRKIKINTYEKKKNKDNIIIINSLDDFNKYTLISVYIIYNEEKIRNVFSTSDFKIILLDIKSMISLKLFMNTKNIDIYDIFPNYKYPPIETFYIMCFLNDKKQTINKEYYKIIINFSYKYMKYKELRFLEKIKRYLYFFKK